MAREAAAKPEPKMTGPKTALVYAIAVPADVLKFLFATFVFSAPFFAATAAKIYLEMHAWPSWAASLIALGAGAAVGAAEVIAAPITAAIGIFGIIMAILIGLTAWLILYLVFLLAGINPFGPRYIWKTWLGWLASVTPFFNLFPTITPAVWRIVHAAHKADREALAQWEQQNAALEEQEARTHIARGQQAAALEREQAEAAANENDEIPEERREAA